MHENKKNIHNYSATDQRCTRDIPGIIDCEMAKYSKPALLRLEAYDGIRNVAGEMRPRGLKNIPISLMFV